MVKTWIELTQWVSTLSDRKISIFLLSVLVSGLGYSRWELKNENTALNIRVERLITSRDSIINDSRLQAKEFEKAKIEILEESNNYWRTKFEEVEKRMHTQYEEIKGIKKRSR